MSNNTNITRVATINLDRLMNHEQKIILGHLTYSSSKLWNVANYEIIEHKVKLCDLKSKLKTHFWYRNLCAQSSQAVIEKLQIAWKNYFHKHTKRPKYRPKDGHMSVIWKQNVKIVDNRIRLSLSKQTRDYLRDEHGIKSKYLWVRLPAKILPLNAMLSIQQIEIVPYQAFGHISYSLRIIYRKEVISNLQLVDPNKVLAIDLGVSNLVTATDGENSFIIDGKNLLSKMRLVAKKSARLKSILDKQKTKTSKRLHHIMLEEKNYVKDYMHKVSRKIVDYCVAKGIGTIAIGEVYKHISSINIGHQNNEKFHRIPFGKLVKMITYKAEEYGITVIEVNESYTSQTCCVCGTVDKSCRKHRGLYVCKQCGNVINADVNGAMNIGQRVVPNFVNGVGIGVLANPVRIRLFEQTSHK